MDGRQTADGQWTDLRWTVDRLSPATGEEVSIFGEEVSIFGKKSENEALPI